MMEAARLLQTQQSLAREYVTLSNVLETSLGLSEEMRGKAEAKKREIEVRHGEVQETLGRQRLVIQELERVNGNVQMQQQQQGGSVNPLALKPIHLEEMERAAVISVLESVVPLFKCGTQVFETYMQRGGD